MVDLAKKFSPVVDEAFTTDSKSSLVTNHDYDFIGAHSIAIYSVGTAEMNDYGRTSEGTSRYGTAKNLDTDIQEEAMEKDRSFTYTIDRADEDETLGALNAGESLARQVREVIIPETDKYVYQKMATKAGNTVEENITSSNAYESLATANEVQDEASVPEQGRVCVCTPEYHKNLKADPEAVLDTEVGQDMRLKGVVANMDGVNIQKVPSRLLPTGANYILAHPVATTFAVKLAEYKIHENAQGVSGSLVEGRIYYTAFVRKNKKNAIYFSKKVAAKKFTVSYDVNGGTGSIDSVEVEEGKSITLNDGSTLTGPTGKTEFKGWAKTQNAQSATVTSPFTPTANTTLYAVWAAE